MCVDDYLWIFCKDLQKLYKFMWMYANLGVINDVLTIENVFTSIE